MNTKYNLLMAIAALIPISVLAQADEIQKSAVVGRTTTMAIYYALNLDCTPLDWMEVRIIEQPKNGKAEVNKAPVIIHYADTNPRKSCNGQQTTAQNVTYTPNEGTLGSTDKLVIETINSQGFSQREIFEISIK